MKNYSIWEDIDNKINCKKITENLTSKVLIIGGGITGINILRELKEKQIDAILIERDKCGFGVTCKSTAKITYLQESIYKNIRKNTGEEEAGNYLKSQIEACKYLKNIITNNNVNCDLKKVNSYIFTNLDKNIKELEEEYLFLKKNGINVEKVKEIPLLGNIKMGIKVQDTYEFHPLKYINFFKEKYQNAIFEHSKLESFRKVGNYYECLVNGKIIKTKYLVIATHYPYFNKNFMLPLRSYIETSFIGAKEVDKFLDVSAINIDNPCISFRYQEDKNKNYLIYLVNSIKSSNIKDISAEFKKLNKNKDFLYLWSNNDIITNDYKPYIGTIKDKLLIATGYNTWGFTNSVLASIIIKDIILDKPNPYKEMVNPKRDIKFTRLISDLYGNAKAIIKGNDKDVTRKIISGKKVLIYKDSKGIEHIVLNKCPHMKCGIVFNAEEMTWECLCHGSRFDIDGKCINGPSNLDITFK